MNRLSFTLAAVLAAALFIALASPAAKLPYKPEGGVSDFARILDADTSNDLAAKIRNLEQQTGIELAVVTVPTLQGRPVEDVANDLFRQWGIGKKGRDNGVLLLVAPNEHRVRIEVGYGLEPKLTDGTCGQIIRERILPRFKAGDYAGGVSTGVEGIGLVLSGQWPPAAASVDYDVRPLGTTFYVLLVVVLLLMFFLSLGRRGWFDGYGFWGGPWGGGPSSGSGGGFGGGFGGGGGGGFGGFGGGSSGGGGASGSW